MSNLATKAAKTEDWLTRLANLETALLAQELPQYISTATATIAPGTEQIFLIYAGATSITLPNPIAGTPGVGSTGQDGLTICITDTTGYAHVVTTGTNGINKSKHIATFSGTVGANAYFKAYGGSWWLQTQSGVTLT